MKNKDSIRWMIILMSFAMIALIGFQFHWIYRDMRLGKTNFERNAKFALNSVLEKYLEYQIISKNHVVINTNFNEFSVDSLTEYYFTSPTGDSISKPSFKVKMTENNRNAIKNDQIVELMPKEGNIRVIIEDVSVEGEKESVRHRVFENNEMVSEIFTGEGTVSKNIKVDRNVSRAWAWSSSSSEERTTHKEKKIDFEFLRQEMKTALEKQGLTLAYVFGVYNQSTKKLLFQDTDQVKDSSLIVQSEFRLPLVGHQLHTDEKVLLLDFPNKDEFLLKELSGVLLTSIALIIIVAACFWFAIRTILHQKKLSEIKNDFINNMTHEFKTPISNVSLAIEALQNFGMMAKPETTQKYLEIAKKENTRLGKQVEKVLQMALLEKEEFKLKIKPVSVHEVIVQVVDSFKLQVEQKGGKIEPQLQATNDLLEADELHLTNVIFNLVDNANKYSPHQPDITIETASTAEGLKIAVIDKGIGIAKDHLQRIFQKFYRVPTGNVHDVKGFGLGLSYVGQIVQRHQGTISVSSKNQQGSRFEILLPFKQ